MPIEVEALIYFPSGSEPPDHTELERAIQLRYPDAVVEEYSEEEV